MVDICIIIKKQTVMQHFILIIAFLISSIAFSQANPDNYRNTQDIIVNMTNFDNNEGKVFVGLYDSEVNFLKVSVKGFIEKIENKMCSVTLKDVPNGIYAISIYHDENDNDKLDMNFMGIPKEDTSCSNNAPARFGPPKWKDAKFEVKNKTIIQNIKL